MSDFSSRRRGQRTSFDEVVLALGAVALALTGLAAWAAYSDLDARRGELTRVSRETRDVEDRARRSESSQGSAEAALAAQAEGTVEAPPAVIVNDLSSLLPAGTRLESLDLEYRDRVFLTLRVKARNPESYDQFLDRLGRSGNFTEVVPGPESRDQEVDASLRAAYRFGAAR